MPYFPLELGLGSKLFWTAGPDTPPGVGSLAMMREDAQGLLERLIPFEIRFLDVLFKPSVRYLSALGGQVDSGPGLFSPFLGSSCRVLPPSSAASGGGKGGP